MEAALLLSLVFVSAMFGISDGAWCVCRPDISDSSLQKALDYACGAGADCGPINQNGACYNPNTVRAHCSYAVNSYYQRKGQTQQACDFAGTAALSQQDPSANGCAFPASSSAAGTSTGTGTSTGVGGTPVAGSGTGTGTGTGATPIGINPGTVTPTSSGTGGVLGGLGPSGNGGVGFSTDSSGQSFIPMAHLGSLMLLILSVLAMLRDFD